MTPRCGADGVSLFRVVLELGCGVGLTGLVVCSGCRPSRYVFSDFHPSVLRRLRANLELNGLGEGPPGGGEGPPGGVQGGGVVRVEELDWESVSEERLREIGADTVIASGTFSRPRPPGPFTDQSPQDFFRERTSLSTWFLTSRLHRAPVL